MEQEGPLIIQVVGVRWEDFQVCPLETSAKALARLRRTSATRWVALQAKEEVYTPLPNVSLPARAQPYADIRLCLTITHMVDFSLAASEKWFGKLKK